LTDLQGKVIAANSRQTLSYQNEPWLDQVVSGQKFASLTQTRLTIATPVMYLENPVETIVMESGPATVAGIVGSGLSSSEGMLLGPEEK